MLLLLNQEPRSQTAGETEERKDGGGVSGAAIAQGLGIQCYEVSVVLLPVPRRGVFGARFYACLESTE